MTASNYLNHEYFKIEALLQAFPMSNPFNVEEL